MKAFVGRDQELSRLEELATSGRSSMVVIKGRRRIGKSRLAEEFGRKKTFLPFSGLAPTSRVSAQDQRDAFAEQLTTKLGLPSLTFSDWTNAFNFLSEQLNNHPTVILLDEISWMGSKDPTFTSKLKIWWDLVLDKRPSVMLILCGSISTWIDKNIINSTAFFGRISLYIELGELTISQSCELLKKQGFKGSDLDLFKILAITGGIPWYLEQIQGSLNADENIKRLCFSKSGLLVHEFDRIFNDLFSSRGEIYTKIVRSLSGGMKDRVTLQKTLKYTKSGSLTAHLKALETCGFVSRHPSWSLKTGKMGKSTLYRLSDNYLRFYMHYIEPNLPKIDQGAFSQVPLSSLPGWEPMLGFQLESLLLKNRSVLYKALGIFPEDIVTDNPYQQKGSGGQKGCQIDYLIQTRSNTLYICEVKMRRRELGLEVIDEMKAKADALACPKGFGISPVLLHLGPVSDALLSSRYFFRILDVTELM